MADLLLPIVIYTTCSSFFQAYSEMPAIASGNFPCRTGASPQRWREISVTADFLLQPTNSNELMSSVIHPPSPHHDHTFGNRLEVYYFCQKMSKQHNSSKPWNSWASSTQISNEMLSAFQPFLLLLFVLPVRMQRRPNFILPPLKKTSQKKSHPQARKWYYTLQNERERRAE